MGRLIFSYNAISTVELAHGLTKIVPTCSVMIKNTALGKLDCTRVKRDAKDKTRARRTVVTRAMRADREAVSFSRHER